MRGSNNEAIDALRDVMARLESATAAFDGVRHSLDPSLANKCRASLSQAMDNVRLMTQTTSRQHKKQ